MDSQIKKGVYRFWVRPMQLALDALGADFNTTLSASQNVVMNASGLAIQGGGATTYKTANTIKFLVGGAYLTLAAQASQAFSAVLPVIPVSSNCAFLVQVSATGVLSTKAGSIAAGATGSVVPPPDPLNAAVGVIFIAMGAGGTFTPGTTALDNANITGSAAVYTDFASAPDFGIAASAPYPRASATQTRSTSAASLDNTVPEPPEVLSQFE